MATRVQVENVSKKMGATQALQNVGTVFEAGRVHGVVGPNGAGKTTLLRLLAGLLHPDEGDILYERGGQTLTAVQERPHIGYFPQEPAGAEPVSGFKLYGTFGIFPRPVRLKRRRF